MDELVNKQKKFFNYIDDVIINNNKLSHAYLIEYNNVLNYRFYVKEFIKKILGSNNELKSKDISLLIDKENYPDVEFIYPDGFWIKKEQLISLEKKFSKKSMIDNKLIYVIDTADKLNDASANTILKFLEEPPEDVIAILVCSNRFKVLDTLVSRCQILSLMNEVIEENNYSDEEISMIDNLDNPQLLLINFDKYYQLIFSDKSQAILFFKNIQFFLNNQVLKKNMNLENKLGNFSMNKIVKYMNIFEEEIKKLDYNVNTKLWFTNFIIRLIEVK